MTGGQTMVVIIVAMAMLASIIRAGIRSSSRRRLACGDDQASGQMQLENQRLRDEVGGLKERIRVLERITVEKENSLAREIESLRDR